MSAKSFSAAPDAWEDDWESQADKLATEPTTTTPPDTEKKVSSKVTKAQRRAAQAEFNRQLWAEAESPQLQHQPHFHYLETRAETVPLRQDFKPAVTVLSRKPQPLASRGSSSLSPTTVQAATAAVQGLRLHSDGFGDNDGDSDDDGSERPAEMTPEERHAKALRDLEEKQRKYEEVRERLFGSPSANNSGASSPGSTTPPRQQVNGGEGKGKGRSRGGGGSGGSRDKRDPSAASGRSRQLYDPGYSPKPTSGQGQRSDRQEKTTERRDAASQPSPRQPVRNPRGPDGSGRGGFGFASRGARGA